MISIKSLVIDEPILCHICNIYVGMVAVLDCNTDHWIFVCGKCYVQCLDVGIKEVFTEVNKKKEEQQTVEDTEQ